MPIMRWTCCLKGVPPGHNDCPESVMIENLSLFFYVVDSGGFTQASRRTRIGKATISRRISELEQELAVALLHRNARQLVMTEAGERLFIRARTIVEEAEAAKSEALDSAGEASGHLRISCPVTLAEVAVGRLAATFTRQNPRVRVTLSVSNQEIDPVADRFDVVIRPSVTPLADSSLCARRPGRSNGAPGELRTSRRCWDARALASSAACILLYLAPCGCR